MLKGINLKSQFLKYVIVLMSGTAIAQIINLGLNIILFREFYDAVDNAEFGKFTRLMGVGVALATARYDLAIPIAKADVHAFRLYRLSLRIAVVSAGVTTLITLVPIIFSGDVSEVLFYALIPVGVFLTAFYNIGTNWAIRKRLFRSISFSKVANVSFGGGIKLLMGWLGSGYIGLIVGTVGGLLFANGWFAATFRKVSAKFSIKAGSPRTKVLARKFDEFPKVNLPHAMMDVSRDLIVAILVSELFTKYDYGSYEHSYRMLRMPLMLAGLAISQV
ncbi:MAG: oligosaccharide flippase family protein, partial [Crocinitomicaceae bacterium]